MGAKIEERIKNFVPGPGSYESGDLDACKNKLPVYSMGAKIVEVVKHFVPGPGSYESGDLDACKEKLPVFTMAPKTSDPTDKTIKPSPNAYSPEKVRTFRGLH